MASDYAILEMMMRFHDLRTGNADTLGEFGMTVEREPFSEVRRSG